MKLKIPNWGSLHKTNLSINPDFQVNQRGQTTYYANGTNWLYTVDMWRINNHSKLYVNDGYIRFHKVDSDQQALLNQVVKTEGKSITVIKVKEINGTATVRFGDSTVTKTITQSGIFTIENDTPISSVAIDLVTNGHYIDIEYIDLWEGDIAYPHVKNKYAYDLMECMEQAERARFTVTATGAYFMSGFSYKVPKKNQPTVQVLSVWNQDGEVTASDFGLTNCDKYIVNFISYKNGSCASLQGQTFTFDVIVTCEPL